MDTVGQRWATSNKTRLLEAVMEGLAGSARISFEGDLRNTRLSRFAGASVGETEALKRNTLSPVQDFVILPLEPEAVPEILKAIGGVVPRSVLHVQIEKAVRLEFGAYDNFSPDCLFLGPALKHDFVEGLLADGVLRPYAKQH